MSACLQIVAFALSCLAAQEQKDVGDVLTAFDADLVDAIRQSRDPNIRSKLTAAAKKVFDTGMQTGQDKTPKSRWGCHQELMRRLLTAEKHFADANDKPERAQWITACKTVFTFELSHAQEPANADQTPTSEEAFNELFDVVVSIKKNYPGEGADDLRKAAYVTAKQIFVDRLKNARAPKKDPQNAYAEELIKIEKTFPLPQTDQPKPAASPTPAPAPSTGKSSSSGGKSSSGGGSKGGGGGSSAEPVKKAFDYNTEPNTLLKTASKQAFDRALAAPKQ